MSVRRIRSVTNIDPPFDVGADFSMDIEIGGASLRPPAAGVAGDGPRGAGWALAGERPGGTTPGGRTRPVEKAV
jgi:hypothetical protein